MRILTDNRRAAGKGYTSREIAHYARERLAFSALLIYVAGHEAYRWWKRHNRWSTKLDRHTARFAKRAARSRG